MVKKKKKTLLAGIGAIETVLTRFITPKKRLPNGNKDHVSTVEITGESDDKKKYKIKLQNQSDLFVACQDGVWLTWHHMIG